MAHLIESGTDVRIHFTRKLHGCLVHVSRTTFLLVSRKLENDCSIIRCIIENFFVASSRGRTAESLRSTPRSDFCPTAMGTSGRTTPQRDHRPVRVALPRPQRPNRRPADEYDGYDVDHRWSSAVDILRVSAEGLHVGGGRTVEQSADLENASLTASWDHNAER
jgi:hypothetical protein